MQGERRHQYSGALVICREYYCAALPGRQDLPSSSYPLSTCSHLSRAHCTLQDLKKFRRQMKEASHQQEQRGGRGGRRGGRGGRGGSQSRGSGRGGRTGDRKSQYPKPPKKMVVSDFVWYCCYCYCPRPQYH